MRPQVALARYPAIMHRAIIVRCPRVFSALWRAVSVFLPERVANRVKLFSSSSRADAASQLGPYIDRAQLPQFLGGEIDTTDPRSPNYVCMGGVVPEDEIRAAEPHMHDPRW